MKKMKKLIMTMLFAISVLALQAQLVKVVEGTKMMREGSFNAFIADLEGVKSSDAEKEWDAFMKEYKAKTKKDKKQNLLVSENVQIPSLGKNPIDVYAMLSEDKSGEGTIIHVWFDTGSGYVNSIDMESQSESATSIVEEYATNVLKEAALAMEKEERNRLKSLDGDLKKLENKDSDLRKDIAKAKENIQKWEKELAQNENEQSAKKKEIRKQNEVLEMAVEKAKKFL
jgi:hypothetical protein